MTAAISTGRAERDERELREAHARIRSLESSLAARGAPSQPPRYRPLLRVAFVLSLVLVACAVAPAIIVKREAVVQSPPGQAGPPPIPAGILSWRAGPVFRERGVSLLDVDGDGAKDIVGLAWRHGQDARPLHVIVIDRKTYAVKWRAGAYPAAWRDETVHLDVSDAGIVVSDGAGVSHVLDRRTGAELGVPTRSKGKFEDEDGKACPADGAIPCTMESPPALATKLPAIFRTPVFPIDYAADGERITIASVSGPHAEAEQYALRWDDEGKKILWKVSLASIAQKNKNAASSPEEWTAIAHGRLFHLYQPSGGGYRITARDTKTGALLYDALVPSLGDGSVIAELTADGDEAFIVANESLLVVDGLTGATTHRFQRF